MKLSEKDIEKAFFAEGTQNGELAPIVYKNGKLFVPTSKGMKEMKKKSGRRH